MVQGKRKRLEMKWSHQLPVQANDFNSAGEKSQDEIRS
jgi:hypothetical protein